MTNLACMEGSGLNHEHKDPQQDAVAGALFDLITSILESVVRATAPEQRETVLGEWERDIIPQALQAAHLLGDTESHRTGIFAAEVILREAVSIVKADVAVSKEG